MSGSLKNPIFVALDVDDFDQVLKLARLLGGQVGGLKVGPRLLMKYGPRVVSELAALAPVFVDNKYYDIPSTMVSAVKATFEAGASFATVHAQAGSEALTQLAQLESELNQKRFFKLLAVTVLTSYSERTLPPNWKAIHTLDHVEALADLTLRSGLSGVVCSPEEVQSLRRRHPNSFLVTPGIRLATANAAGPTAADDQSRVMTPKAALAAGASALVIGRPIIAAADPAAALSEILSGL